VARTGRQIDSDQSTPKLPKRAGSGASRNVRCLTGQANRRRGGLTVLVLDTDLLTILLRGPATERARLLAWPTVPMTVRLPLRSSRLRNRCAGGSQSSPRRRRSSSSRQHMRGSENCCRTSASCRCWPLMSSPPDDLESCARKYRRHGAADLKIASVCDRQRCHVLTRNIRDFHDFVDELSVDNPWREAFSNEYPGNCTWPRRCSTDLPLLLGVDPLISATIC